MNRVLIVGSGSQLSYYLRENILSRGLHLNTIKAGSFENNLNILNEEWQEVYLAFGESRKSGVEPEQYDLVNYDLTKKYINILKNTSKKIVCFSTCELWSGYTGPVDVNLPWNYKSNPYTDSKRKISEYVLDLDLENVIVSYPFNFNSPIRTKEFLFGKIFQSILLKKRIEIGNTNFKRDILHPRFLTHRILEMKTHEIIGSGRLTHIRSFIDDIYKFFNMDSCEWITESSEYFNQKEITEYYANSKKIQSYESLLKETVDDLKAYKE